jgi:hypothetical protein
MRAAAAATGTRARDMVSTDRSGGSGSRAISTIARNFGTSAATPRSTSAATCSSNDSVIISTMWMTPYQPNG